MTRCPWPADNELMIRYHDTEWGTPVHDDLVHFEFLVLESAQAGLNWLTILKKREGYRAAYRGFDPIRVARFAARDVDRLLGDSSIVRNRLKILSSINNAKRFLEVRKEFGSFEAYIWKWVKGRPVVNAWKTLSEIPPRSALSDEVSKDLKARGFTFAGSTIIYAHLQATGIVNDHIVGCFRRRELRSRPDSKASIRFRSSIRRLPGRM
jgi:DNA-3-methyladenine glycosylase I